MPTIEISQETFSKLQRLAAPFVDTPETVISRIADEALKSVQHAEKASPIVVQDWIELDPAFTGNLAHTRLRRASFDNEEIEPPKWNGLLRVAHLKALEAFGSYTALKAASSARLKEGKYESEGFKYVPGGNFSIQGLDSNLSWSSTLRLARKLNVPVEVEFDWYNKEEAAHPGKRGHIIWQPDSN